jgi:hypothetical protein
LPSDIFSLVDTFLTLIGANMTQVLFKFFRDRNAQVETICSRIHIKEDKAKKNNLLALSWNKQKKHFMQ